MADNKIPYKIYLTEEEMPKSWYNLRADMKNKPAPLLNPGTLQPLKAEELAPIFCEELVAQELDETTPYIEIYVLTAWRKNCRHRQRFIISSKATTPAAATSSIPPLLRLIMPRSRASRVLRLRPAPASGALPSPWPAPILILTVKSSWSRSPMSRSLSAAKSCAPMAHLLFLPLQRRPR